MQKSRNPYIASLLTLLFLGFGQIYNGQLRRGLAIYLIGIMGIILVSLPSILSPFTLLIAPLWTLCIYGYAIINAWKIAKVNKDFRLKRYNRWYGYLLLYVGLMFFTFLFATGNRTLIQAFKIPSGSMQPTLLIGDHTLVNKMVYHFRTPKLGEIVIYKFPEKSSKTFVGRVIGVPGSKIEIIKKVLYRNDSVIHEPYIQHTNEYIMYRGEYMGNRDNYGPVVVSSNSYFIMGDNRDESFDSRFRGYIKQKALIGKAYAIYWSIDKYNGKVRWSRLFTKIP